MIFTRTLLALALAAALAGCMSESQNESEAATTTPDAMATDDAMAASDNMGGDAMAGDTAMASTLEPARYQVVFSSRWTEKDHPLEYPGPQFAGLSVAHFSPIIGASHASGYALFAEGSLPSPGLESLSETGKHAPLDAEINSAMGSGAVLALFESADPLKDHSKTVMAEVSVDGAHSQVSLVAMIAPSPDWFAGVKDVDLVENGQWIGEKTVDLMPYDSGGDDGATYRADDADTNPKKATSAQTGNPHFFINGKLLPVASVTFKKL